MNNYHMDSNTSFSNDIPSFDPSDFGLQDFPNQDFPTFQAKEWSDDFDFSSLTFTSESTHVPLDQFTVHSSPKYDSSESFSLGSPLSLGSKKISKQSQLSGLSADDYELLFGESKPARNKRRGWSHSEDAELLRLIDIHGKKWTDVARLMNGRNGKQVRDRYVNVLMPNIKKKNWTIAEDQLIVSLYAEFGPKWTKIAEHMDGRPEVQVKNRFYTCLKKHFDELQASKKAQESQNNKNSSLEKCLERIEEITQPEGSFVMMNQDQGNFYQDPTDMISFLG